MDIELRVPALVIEALAVSGSQAPVVVSLVRLAYGAGYTDALTEPVRGQLCLDHGFSVPRPHRR